MKRRYLILLFTAAFTAVLSPCVEAFSYALAKERCHTEKTCCSKDKNDVKEAPAASASHCGNHSDESHGQCSSLCHCSCCGHVVTAFYVFVPMLRASSILQQQPKYYSQYRFDYTDFIWQPPRLV